MKAWISVSVIGSVIGASYNAEVRADRPLGWARQGRHRRANAILFERTQGRSGSPQARHQSPDRDAECVRGLFVGEALDRDEVKDGPLLVRQGQERSADLLEADTALLIGEGCDL